MSAYCRSLPESFPQSPPECRLSMASKLLHMNKDPSMQRVTLHKHAVFLRNKMMNSVQKLLNNSL